MTLVSHGCPITLPPPPPPHAGLDFVRRQLAPSDLRLAMRHRVPQLLTMLLVGGSPHSTFLHPTLHAATTKGDMLRVLNENLDATYVCILKSTLKLNMRSLTCSPLPD